MSRGTTIMQIVGLAIDGALLWESFEAVNWQANQNWTTAQGTPVSSTDVAHDGLRSLIMDNTRPIIEKTLDHGYLRGWFYDDHTETASTFKPFILCRKTSGNNWGLGVDNSVSTTHYTKIANGVSSVTTIARTTAWHSFTFERVGSDYILKVDGTDVAVPTGTGTADFDRVRIGAKDNTGTGFGYFDHIQIRSSPTLTIRGLEPGQEVDLYEEDGTPVGTTQTASVDNVTYNLDGYDQPLPGYFTLTKADGVSPLLRSPVVNLNSGDTRTRYKVDFGRRVTQLDPRPTARRQDKEANAGPSEHIFFHARDIVSFTIMGLTDDQRRELLAWWSLAQDGTEYSVAIDSSEIYDGRLTATADANSTTLTVDSAVGLSAGQLLQLKRSNNKLYEPVEVQSIAGNVVTLTTATIHSYLVDDVLRSRYHWPMAETTDQDLKLTLTDGKIKRWTLAHNFKESLN